MGIIGWIVIGLIAGVVARWLMPGPDPMGWLGTILLGIVGSLVGGKLLNLLFGGGLQLAASGILPSILGAIVLIIVGWIVAGVLAALVVRVLRAIRIDQLAEKAGITGFLRRANVRADAAGVVAGLVKWYVRLVFLLLAANAVGLTAVSGIVTNVLGFIPNLIVAMFILGVFSWLASTAKNLVSGGMESAA